MPLFTGPRRPRLPRLTGLRASLVREHDATQQSRSLKTTSW